MYYFYALSFLYFFFLSLHDFTLSSSLISTTVFNLNFMNHQLKTTLCIQVLNRSAMLTDSEYLMKLYPSVTPDS